MSGYEIGIPNSSEIYPQDEDTSTIPSISTTPRRKSRFSRVPSFYVDMILGKRNEQKIKDNLKNLEDNKKHYLPKQGKPRFKWSYLNKSQLLWLLKLASSEICYISIGICGMLITAGCANAIPYFVGQIVDTPNTRNPQESLIRLLIILSALIVTQSICTFIRSFFFGIAGERIVAKLRKQLFEKIMYFDVSFFDENSTGELLNRLASDTKSIENVITIDIKRAGRFLIQFIGGLGVIFWISWKLSLLAIGAAPFMGLASLFYSKIVKRLSRKFQDSLADSSGTADETIKNIKTVKSFCQEKRHISQYSEKIGKSLYFSNWISFGRGSYTGIMALLSNCGFLGAVWLGGYLLIQNNEITAGTLSSFLFYLIYIVNASSALTELYYEVLKSLGATERLYKIIHTKPSIDINISKRIPENINGTIEFKNVKFEYPTRKNTIVLNGLDISVDSGKIVALCGESGCGKSTIFSLLQRFYDPIEGSILIDGTDIREFDVKHLRRMITTVSQEPNLFETSIKENIAYGNPYATMDQIIQAAKSANAHDFIMSFEHGYDTLVGEGGKKLSVGQKQRIAIARAILLDPKILLLDECTSALDAESEAIVTKALEKLMEGRTVMIIAHRLSTIKNAHKIYIISKGVVVESGTHDELIQKKGAYAKLVEHQKLIAKRTRKPVVKDKKPEYSKNVKCK